MKIKMGRSFIGDKYPAYIVAEVSANHNHDINLALEMIKKAKGCGANAVKFQAYTPDTLTIDSNESVFKIEHPKWGGQSLYNLYKKAYTPWEWFPILKKECDKLDVMFFATAFDNSSVDMLEDLNVPVHKIASFELVDLPLIEYAAGTKKPLILSTGMASVKEIKEAVQIAKRAGAPEVVILKCVSSYPASPESMNLRTIPDMIKRFKVPVGISDHTLDTGVSAAAVVLGACMVEKHFVLTRDADTPDSFFSSEPKCFQKLVNDIREVEVALGKISYGPTVGEKNSLFFRRSLFVVKDVKKGDEFSEDNVRSIRPSAGLAPKEFGNILGKKAGRDIKKGTPLKIKYIEGFERA